MEYVRVDENLPEHPKVLEIPRDRRTAAMWLYVRGLCYASRLETDGILPGGICESDADDAAAEALCEAKLWHRKGSSFEINDFLDFNRSAAEIAAIRDKRREAGSRGGVAKAKRPPSKPLVKPKQTAGKTVAKACPTTETKTETETERDKETAKDAVSPRGDFAKVATRLEQVTGNTLGGTDSVVVHGWCRSFDTDRILAAIDRAAGRGKTRVAYIGTIIAEEPVTAPKPAEKPIKFGVLR